MSDEDKNLLVNLNGNGKTQILSSISSSDIKNKDTNISTRDEPFYEITNNDESIKTTFAAVPGTPADRATN
jgi:predicted ATP-binding protein involved in virulence